MTKVSIKNEIIFNFGGIYHVADKFDQTIGKTIVETLGKRHSIESSISSMDYNLLSILSFMPKMALVA